MSFKSESLLVLKDFLFFFFRIKVDTSSLTVESKSLRISRMRSPSELEVVESASGERRAMIGDVKGVSKSSRDKGLVIGLGMTFTLETASEAVFKTGFIGLIVVELELSIEASEDVSDLVGLPPTLGFCGGGLGGGANGLEGRVVAMEAGLLAEDFLVVAVALFSGLVGLLCFLGVMGGGCLLLVVLGGEAVLEAIEILGSASVGVASEDRQTGTKFVLLSRFDCKMGPEMSSLVNRSGLGGA